MNLHNIFTVYGKELRDSLRDRRTLLSMFVIPALLVPGIMISAVGITMRAVKQASGEIPTVMVLGGDDSPVLRTALTKNPKLQFVPFAVDWKQQISDKRLRAAVDIPAGFESAVDRGLPAEIKIYNYEGELRSDLAAGQLRDFLNGYREQTVTARLVGRGLPATLVKPFETKTQNVAPPEKVTGNRFGGMIPYLFIILCFTGAMYPAMDLTAGEKERGTMETILCSPVARTDLVLGKFLMVLTASLTTAVVSILTTGITLVIIGLMAGNPGAAAQAGVIPTLDPAGLLLVLAMVLPVAVLFCAVLLAVSLFAKSIKEASSYATPLIFLIIVPAMMGMMPGVELNAKLALVPILNIALASKELVSGVFHWNYLALIFGSTCVYAAAALAVCVRLFNREDVLFRT
jgi:sodium transport system permease protein